MRCISGDFRICRCFVVVHIVRAIHIWRAEHVVTISDAEWSQRWWVHRAIIIIPSSYDRDRASSICWTKEWISRHVFGMKELTDPLRDLLKHKDEYKWDHLIKYNVWSKNVRYWLIRTGTTHSIFSSIHRTGSTVQCYSKKDAINMSSSICTANVGTTRTSLSISLIKSSSKYQTSSSIQIF